MKKVLALGIVLLTILSGCGKSGNGELVGVARRASFYEPDPFGMLFIPQGSFNMGLNDQDVTNSMTTQTRTISIPSFWMDETEITNSEYRQFVHWVRDSIARRMLGDQFEEFLISEDRYGNIIDPPYLDWNARLEWDNEEYAEILEDLFLSEGERFFRRKEIDSRKLNYDYEWVDLHQAAKKTNRYNFETNSYEGEVFNQFGERAEISDRSAFIMKDQVNVYPDTLAWISDFTYSFNEPWTEMYFWHPGFDEYPVVGVSWKQATAFAIWMHDMSPTYKYNALPGDHHVMKRKVIRGGSWKDIAFFLQNSTRTYEYQDSSKSYIGFRCIRDYIGN
ncbi:MAG: SUMF1/EgtB/PvdO family nonheme iron enzyme [Bacteroidales bacterium]|nr:SUMF1/EgtB/PvdO family nonheme iron enzyme [Bacteroidales bacterium]